MEVIHEWHCTVCGRIFKLEETEDIFHFVIVVFALCPDCSEKVVRQVKGENDEHL